MYVIISRRTNNDVDYFGKFVTKYSRKAGRLFRSAVRGFKEKILWIKTVVNIRQYGTGWNTDSGRTVIL